MAKKVCFFPIILVGPFQLYQKKYNENAPLRRQCQAPEEVDLYFLKRERGPCTLVLFLLTSSLLSNKALDCVLHTY